MDEARERCSLCADTFPIHSDGTRDCPVAAQMSRAEEIVSAYAENTPDAGNLYGLQHLIAVHFSNDHAAYTRLHALMDKQHQKITDLQAEDATLRAALADAQAERRRVEDRLTFAESENGGLLAERLPAPGGSASSTDLAWPP